MGSNSNMTLCGAGGGSLRAGLTAWWEMDEATAASRVDKTFGTTLTNTGGATQVAGKSGNGTAFNGTTQYLVDGIGEARLYAHNIDFTMCGWFNFVAVPAVGNTFAGKTGKVGFNIRAGPEFQVTYNVNPSGPANVGSNAGFTLTTATWYFMAISFNTAANIIWVKTNGDEKSWTPAGLNDDNTVVPGSFTIGADSAKAVFMSGTADQIGFWRGRALSLDDLRWLYNSGNGRAFAEL